MKRINNLNSSSGRKYSGENYKEDKNSQKINLWDLNPKMNKKNKLCLFDDPSDSDDNNDLKHNVIPNKSKKGVYKKRQVSLPSSFKQSQEIEKDFQRNSSLENKEEQNINNKNPTKKQSVINNGSSNKKKKRFNHSIDKSSESKKNLNIGFTDFQDPDKMIRFYKNKCNEKKGIPPQNGNNNNKKKTSKNIEKIGQNLYNKKTLSNDYELQNKMKKIKEEEKEKKEMEECTFKPKLYSHNLYYQNQANNKVQNDDEENKDIYHRQNKWLNSVDAKKEKNFEMTQNKQLKDCSFVPKTTKMPDFNKQSAKNKYYAEKDICYAKMKKEMIQNQEANKKNKVKDLVKDYDERKKKQKIASTSQYSIGHNMNNNENNNLDQCFKNNSFCQLPQNENQNINNKLEATAAFPNTNSNSNFNNSNNNNKEISSPDSNINKYQRGPKEDLDFLAQKEQLKNELYNWNNDEEDPSSEEDDFVQ